MKILSGVEDKGRWSALDASGARGDLERKWLRLQQRLDSGRDGSEGAKRTRKCDVMRSVLSLVRCEKGMGLMQVRRMRLVYTGRRAWTLRSVASRQPLSALPYI